MNLELGVLSNSSRLGDEILELFERFDGLRMILAEIELV
jgi:hypothetical protein